MNLNALIRPNILALQPYSSARDEFQGEASVFLDANESPWPSGLNRYPDPQQKELRAAIATQFKCLPNQIFTGNGSDEAIDLLFRIFCRPGQDRAIVLPPTYGMYSVSAAINDVSIDEVSLSDGFQPDLPGIQAAIRPETKLLFLCSPNNPTGNSFEAEAVRKLIREFPGIVVIDEAYADFSGEKSWITEIENFDNLLVLRTFSKAWGLAAARVGMAFGNSELIEWLDRVKPPYNLSQPAQNAALKALEQSESVQNQIQETLAERKVLIRELEKFPEVITIFPSDANFILVRFRSALPTFEALLARGIVVRNRSKLPNCEGCLRITIGTKSENRTLIGALSDLFSTTTLSNSIH